MDSLVSFLFFLNQVWMFVMLGILVFRFLKFEDAFHIHRKNLNAFIQDQEYKNDLFRDLSQHLHDIDNQLNSIEKILKKQEEVKPYTVHLSNGKNKKKR